MSKEYPHNIMTNTTRWMPSRAVFANVGTDASATLVKGLDKESIESVLTNAIAPLSDPNASNYDVSDSRVIFGVGTTTLSLRKPMPWVFSPLNGT